MHDGDNVLNYLVWNDVPLHATVCMAMLRCVEIMCCGDDNDGVLCGESVLCSDGVRCGDGVLCYVATVCSVAI